MKACDIDRDLIETLLRSVPPLLDVTSIDFSDGNIRVFLVADLNMAIDEISDQHAKESMDELQRLIRITKAAEGNSLIKI